jgi:hypothetical protein
MSANDPALSNADWVRQFILSPPFAWWWNRVEVPTIQTQAGVTDYVVSLPSFGWIEKAVLFYPDNGNVAQELEVENNLAPETIPNLPLKIAAQLGDDAGNVTFRLSPAPDAVYNLSIITQKSAATFANLSDFWTPVPNYLSYVYNELFLYKALEYMNDPRSQEVYQVAMQSLISANMGLSDDQKSIFLGDRLNKQRQSQNVASGRA